MNLTKITETSSTITFGWTPPAGVGGYVFYANGEEVAVATKNNKDGTPRDEVKFSKTSPGPPFHVVAVVRSGTGAYSVDVGSYADSPPPPPSGGDLGLVLNAAPTQAWLDRAATLNPSLIRDDTITTTKVNWAAAHSADFIGLTTNQLSAVAIVNVVNAWPTITMWELDNEPYLIGAGFDIAAWARRMRDAARTIKQQHPSHVVLVPLYANDNGDAGHKQVNASGVVVASGGTWTPWVNVMLNAAPDLPQYVDGWSIHPYSGPFSNPPEFATVNTVKGHLQARNAFRPWYITEFGWSVGTLANLQVSATQQASYIQVFIDQARARGDVAKIIVYCLQTWGAGFQESFGLFNQDLSDRPAAEVFRNNV